MDYLWTPGRYACITEAAKNEAQSANCIFCEPPKLEDRKAKIVYRGTHCYLILNTFPYTSGHVMVVPFAHLDELGKGLMRRVRQVPVCRLSVIHT